MSRLSASLQVLFFSIAISIALGAGPARAQDAFIEQARMHFDAAEGFYGKDDFAKAAAEFMAAYAVKPFAALLFNAATCHEKLNEMGPAIGLFERYLKEDPTASDRADVERRIAALKAEQAPAPASTGAASPSATGAPAAPAGAGAASAATKQPVRDGRTKGLTVIESNPEGAIIRLDGASAPELGTTTWSGQLPDGQHTVFLEHPGYKTEQKVIQPARQSQFAYYFFRLAEDAEFGFLVVTSNVPDALIYLDEQPGVWGRVSSERNLKKGKHHIGVAREGYLRKELDIEVRAGQVSTVPVQLEVASNGWVRVRGDEGEVGAKVQLDGKEVCATVPCRFEAQEGNRKILVSKQGKNDYVGTLHIDRLTESTMTLKLSTRPSRTGSITYFVVAAALVAAGAIAGTLANQASADLFAHGDADVANGFRIGYYAAGGVLAAVFLGVGLDELLNRKGDPSTATTEKRDITLLPVLGPQYAGMQAAWRW